MSDPTYHRAGDYSPETLFGANAPVICDWCAGNSEFFDEMKDMLEECLATFRRTHDDVLLDHEVEWTLNRLNHVSLQIQDLLKRMPSKGVRSGDECEPWYERAIRAYERLNGPSGDAWNVSAMLNCLREKTA